MKIQLTRRGKGVAILASMLVVALAIPTPVYALFGVEDTVEPGPLWTTQLMAQYTVFGNIWSQDVSNYLKIVETVSQLEKIYSQGMQMYNLATALSQSFSGANKSEWVTVAQMAVQDVSRDQYGENRMWSSTLNGNPNSAAAAWQMSTLALNNGTYLATQQLGSSPGLARLASIEAVDGSSSACLATLAQYHGNALANALGPVMKWAIAKADGTASTNSEIQQLNLILGGQGQANTELFAQGQMNACMLQQMILANKMQRDSQVEAMNDYAAVQQKYASNPAMPSGFSSLATADIQ